jgi:hypothetical protein
MVCSKLLHLLSSWQNCVTYKKVVEEMFKLCLTYTSLSIALWCSINMSRKSRSWSLCSTGSRLSAAPPQRTGRMRRRSERPVYYERGWLASCFWRGWWRGWSDDLRVESSKRSCYCSHKECCCTHPSCTWANTEMCTSSRSCRRTRTSVDWMYLLPPRIRYW